MSLADDQHAFQDLAAQGADKALADRVPARCLDGGAQDPGARSLEDGVARAPLYEACTGIHCVRPSGLPLTCSQQMDHRPSGFLPELHTPQRRQSMTHAGSGDGR